MKFSAPLLVAINPSVIGPSRSFTHGLGGATLEMGSNKFLLLQHTQTLDITYWRELESYEVRVEIA